MRRKLKGLRSWEEGEGRGCRGGRSDDDDEGEEIDEGSVFVVITAVVAAGSPKKLE